MKNIVYWHKEDSALDEKWCRGVKKGNTLINL